ncbi:embryonic polyadenylate-binding protein 2 [Mustela lutreola]|uniref:embryonic polyadenylate-binding protein 2 n=1 Tax=Mustela lutreola TaxID=9666 RepID=UPI0027972073|nr:embryonic polyadenylate-binding protein 2 [Mustela lutreola]
MPVSSHPCRTLSRRGRAQKPGLAASPVGSLLSALVGAAGLGRRLKPWGRAGAGAEPGGQGRPPAATHVACCRGHTLFPPPTEAWLQSLSRDPEAQDRGARKPALGSGGGDRREEEPGEAEEDQEDEKAGSLLSLWSGEDLAERPKPDQAGARGHQTQAVGHGADPRAGDAQGTGAAVAPQLLSLKAGGLRGHSRGAGSLLQPLRGGPPDHHPVCQVLRTPQGVSASQLCIELDTKSSAQAAVGLDETVVPGRVIKYPQRTCLGASSEETQLVFLEAALALGSAALRKRRGEQVSPRESACGARPDRERPVMGPRLGPAQLPSQ